MAPLRPSSRGVARQPLNSSSEYRTLRLAAHYRSPALVFALVRAEARTHPIRGASCPGGTHAPTPRTLWCSRRAFDCVAPTVPLGDRTDLAVEPIVRQHRQRRNLYIQRVKEHNLWLVRDQLRRSRRAHCIARSTGDQYHCRQPEHAGQQQARCLGARLCPAEWHWKGRRAVGWYWRRQRRRARRHRRHRPRRKRRGRRVRRDRAARHRRQWRRARKV